MSSHLAGRDAALAELNEWLRMAAAEQSTAGRVCAVTGEAGVGKTRLLGELVAFAHERDFVTMCGQAHEYDRSVAYTALKDLLQSLQGHQLGDEEVSRLDELLVAIDGVVDDREYGELHPQRIVDLLTRLLRRLSRRVFVVVLDDADLADDSSLIALSLAIRNLRGERFLVVASTRRDCWTPGSAFAATLGRLAEQAGGAVLHLEALTRLDIRLLVQAEFDREPDIELIDHVFERSHGIPLFARETIYSLRATGSIRIEESAVYLVGDAIPTTVSGKGALLHRVFRRDALSLDVARVMSVFGRLSVTELPLLAKITDLHPSKVQEELDNLVAASIIKWDGFGSFTFAHPLIAEVLYDDLGPVERRRIHASLCERFGTTPPTGSRILHWARDVVESAEPGDPRAVDAALLAANALHNAPLSAGRWYQRALDLMSLESPDRGALLARQATAYWKGSRPELAVEAGTNAGRLLPLGPLRTATLVNAVGAAYSMGRIPHALDLLEGTDHATTPSLLAQRGLLLAHLGQTDLAQEVAERAWCLVADAPPADQVAAYSYLAHIAQMLGRGAESRIATDRLVEIGSSDHSGATTGMRLSALETSAYTAIVDERLHDAQSLMDKADRISETVGWNDIGGQAILTRSRVSYWSGRWDEALHLAESGVVKLEFANLKTNLLMLRLLKVDILIERGEVRRAKETLATLRPEQVSPYSSLLFEVRQARIAMRQARYVDAERSLEGAASKARQIGWLEAEHQALVSLVECCISQGEEERAEGSVNRLQSLADVTGLTHVRHAATLATARTVGSLEMAQEVLDFSRVEGLVPLELAALATIAALPCADEATVELAFDHASRLRADPLVRLLSALARSRGIALSRTKADASKRSQLTTNERRLVELVGDGLSNRQIADVLHYSRKTVEAYLSRLYRKTGTNSRMALLGSLRDQPI